MPTLFDLLSLFYVYLGIRAIARLIKNRAGFTDDELTPLDRRIASEIAFFVFIPIGVLFHELGHAAATYQVGGTIDWLGGGFHYALFWGYVIPEGDFSRLQDWWIALSGNLVSVIYGFLPLLFLRFTNKGWIKYTILSFARIQLGWSLVGYPLITLTGIDSDWSTIYSPQMAQIAIPLFVVHISLVAALWMLDRSRWVKRWELSLFPGVDERMRSLDAALDLHYDKASHSARVTEQNVTPEALDALISRGNLFASHGEFREALADYRRALEVSPHNVRALYNVAQIHMVQKHYGPAEKAFRTALAQPQQDLGIRGRLHYGLGLCLYQNGKTPEALAEFDRAIADVPDVADFYYWRGLARRQRRETLAARNDFRRAADMAATDDPALAQQAREMLNSTQ